MVRSYTKRVTHIFLHILVMSKEEYCHCFYFHFVSRENNFNILTSVFRTCRNLERHHTDCIYIKYTDTTMRHLQIHGAESHHWRPCAGENDSVKTMATRFALLSWFRNGKWLLFSIHSCLQHENELSKHCLTLCS